MKTHLEKSRAVAIASLLILSLGDQVAAAAGREACDLVPPAEVARIVGAEMPVVQRQPWVERDGAASSACYFQEHKPEGMKASLTVQTFPSQSAAQAVLRSYGERWAKLNGTIVTEIIAGLPTTTITLPTGFAQIWALRGGQLVAAGVTSLHDGKSTPMHEQARALLVASLKNL